MFKKYSNKIRTQKLSYKKNNIKILIKIIIIVALLFIGYKLFFIKVNYNDIVEISREFDYQDYSNSTTITQQTATKTKLKNTNKNDNLDNIEMLDVLIPINNEVKP